MTREEKEKAISALKISAPIVAMTPNEFDDYIKTLNKIADWLEQKSCGDCISRKAVLDLVEDMTDQFGVEHRVITEGVISMLPPVTPEPKTDVFDKIRAEIDRQEKWLLQAGCTACNVNIALEAIKAVVAEKE